MAEKTKNTVQKQVESASKAMDSLRWVVSYDYDKDCSRCNLNDYHRHCVITAFRMEDVHMGRVLESVLENVTHPILAYCIDRILHIDEVYDKERWSHSVSQGYYGEEIDSVSFDGKHSVIEKMWELVQMDDRERILKVLEWEYGSVLPVLEACKTFTVEDVPIASITFPNDHYTTKVKLSGKCAYYAEWPRPLGVVVPSAEPDKLKVIDGYHRLTTAFAERAAIKKKDKTVKVVVGR